MSIRGCAIYVVLIVLGSFMVCAASELNLNICEQVGSERLALLYRSTLFPNEETNGCRWSDRPGGKAFFQIGVLKSQKNLSDFFEKTLPPDFELIKINELGDRGLMTVSKGYLAVIAVREGDWVLISTVDLLYLKQGEERQKVLWDIYREILQNLP